MFERFTRAARVAVVSAQEDARELHADEIRPEHLLLGILHSAGPGLSTMLGGYGLTAEALRSRLAGDDASLDQDAEALRSIGIDLRAVRDSVARTFGADAFDNALRHPGRRRRWGHLPFTRAAKKALELGLREALAHKDTSICCEHLLLGILRGGDTVTLGLIAERVPAPALRAAILELLDEAA